MPNITTVTNESTVTIINVLNNINEIVNVQQVTNFSNLINLTSFSDTKIQITEIAVVKYASGANLGLKNRIDDIKGYISFAKTNGNITNKSIYTDDTKTTKLYNYDITYINDIPTQKIITEISSGETLTYDYTIVDGDIVNILIS